MPGVGALATRESLTQKQRAPRGPLRYSSDAACDSEARTHGSEHGGVVAALLADRHAGTDVRVQTEHARARTEGKRAVVLIELDARHRVRRGARQRLQLRPGFARRVFELAVVGQARVRLEVLIDRVAGLPAGA